MGLFARADIFLSRVPGPRPANDRNGSRNDGASETSRHVTETSGADVLIHLAQDVVELACSDIALDLLIPLVVLPAMEPGSKFGPLFK